MNRRACWLLTKVQVGAFGSMVFFFTKKKSHFDFFLVVMCSPATQNSGSRSWFCVTF